jgi:protein O-mannosyl-transferase
MTFSASCYRKGSPMSKRKEAPKKDARKAIPPKSTQRRLHLPIYHLIAIGLIAGVAFLAYSNTFSVPFHFDDRPNIIDNPNIQIKAFTWDKLEQLVTRTYKVSIRVFSYFTLALNYHFGEFGVFGYHLVNFIVHVACGIFVYWFILLTLNLPSLKEKYGSISYKAALFTGLIFISHPVQTQSVTYIVQRMTSMSAMFYFLSLILYIKGRLSIGNPRFFYYGGMVLSYLLGVFSKENTAILPIFVALYEFYFFQNLDLGPRGKKVLLILLLGLLLLGAFAFAVWGQRYIDVTREGYDYRTFTMSERLLTQARVVLYYVSLLIYPHPSRLNLDYDFLISKTILDPPTTLISILVIFGLIGFSFWTARKRPILSFFTLWYFGNLVIESSIFPLEMVYEHRLYLPAVGPFLLFSLLTIRVIEKLKARVGLTGRCPATPAL